MYRLIFISKDNKRYDFAEFGALPHETVLDKLCGVVYIMQGFVPMHWNWKEDLLIDGQCLFNLNGVLTAILSYNQENKTFVVRDI